MVISTTGAGGAPEVQPDRSEAMVIIVEEKLS